MNCSKTIALGIGNPLLQDDRAGLEVVQRLSSMDLSVDIQELYTVGLDVLDRLMGYDRAFVVDACKLGYQPGTVVEVTVDDIFSSHSLSNSHAITLGATLKTGYELFPDQMPGEIYILLIEVEKIEEFTNVMTEVVENGVDRAVASIAARIKGEKMSCQPFCQVGST
ncbi:hydrogenase maturation protease [Desulfonatronovibrio hydrogenovorans]|uniref:hydrogenase maturation protease n=1 Tax=Desulfonatronovibrio hydrogenovorans TaxID=53245 RepID=UPI000691D18C|nr:hydrogenase maturation protease [Desulfonatronovibrio hydrogenovorans]